MMPDEVKTDAPPAPENLASAEDKVSSAGPVCHGSVQWTGQVSEDPGRGVHRGPVNIKPPDPVSGSAKVAAKWGDGPVVEDQHLQGPDLCRVERVELVMLDLSVADHAKRYGDIMTAAMQPVVKFVVVANDRKWAESKSTWMACLELHHLSYRQNIT